MKELYIISSKPEIVKQLSQELGCSPLFAHLLASRGLESAAAAARFLKAPLSDLDLANCLHDMDRAVARIIQGLQQRQKILVFGDYDVDGVTATLVLTDFLQNCGARVRHYIPHRVEEGYGLFPHHLDSFTDKPDLIVTVDCGAGSRAAISHAQKLGIDVVVSDHHRVEGELTGVSANINPKRPECKSGKTYLCGVGIVFLLLIHLRKALRKLNFWQDSRCEPNLKQYCDLVALGTIADVCPLVGENRIFVKAGLQMVNSSPRPGLKALMEQNCKDEIIDVRAAAFKMIPVLNAAGRMRHAGDSVKLLAAKDAETADRLCRELLKLNRKRQQMEQETMQAILQRLETSPALLQKKALVVSGQGWHEGILGILAARLAEKYAKPALVISERDGACKGSGRTPEWLDLFQCLTNCNQYLTNFGGHRLAAGLSLPAANLETFSAAFEKAVGMFEPRPANLRVDAEVTLNQLTPDFMCELMQMEPYGEGHPEPLFLARDVDVLESRLLGSQNNHLKLRLKQNGSETFDAICFSYTQMRRPGAQIEQLLFHLRWNIWNGQRKLQIIVTEV